MLPNTVEGFVPLHSLEEDFYEYQQASFQISGRQTKHIYSLGQKVSVMVKHADTIIGKIEFELVSA